MNGSLDRTIDELKQADVSYVLYNGIGANPLKSAVEEGARIGRENGVDFVVALGGGSVMDAAKNMAMFIPQPSGTLFVGFDNGLDCHRVCAYFQQTGR